MLQKYFFSSIKRILQILNKPMDVLIICVGMTFFVLVIEGGLFQLIELHRESSELENNIIKVEKRNKGLAMKIRRASDLDFIEHEARDRFDLVGKNDLIFIFSEEEMEL